MSAASITLSEPHEASKPPRPPSPCQSHTRPPNLRGLHHLVRATRGPPPRPLNIQNDGLCGLSRLRSRCGAVHIFAHGGDFSWPRVLVLIGAVLLRSADFVGRCSTWWRSSRRSDFVTGAVNRDFWTCSSFADFVAGTALCDPRCADFVAGAALGEPQSVDFVAGTALREPRSADFVAGAALGEPRSAVFVAGTALGEPCSADFRGRRSTW